MAEIPDETIQQFMALTNVSHNIAVQYLSEFGDLNEALNSYYASQTDDQKDRREEAHWKDSRRRPSSKKPSPPPTLRIKP